MIQTVWLKCLDEILWCLSNSCLAPGETPRLPSLLTRHLILPVGRVMGAEGHPRNLLCWGQSFWDTGNGLETPPLSLGAWFLMDNQLPWPCRIRITQSPLTWKALMCIGGVMCLWAVQWWVCARGKPGTLCLFQPGEMMEWDGPGVELCRQSCARSMCIFQEPGSCNRSWLWAGRFLLFAPLMLLSCNSYWGKSETVLGVNLGPPFCPLLMQQSLQKTYPPQNFCMHLLSFLFSLVVSPCSWSRWVQTFILEKTYDLIFSLDVYANGVPHCCSSWCWASWTCHEFRCPLDTFGYQVLPCHSSLQQQSWVTAAGAGCPERSEAVSEMPAGIWGLSEQVPAWCLGPRACGEEAVWILPLVLKS